MQIWFHVYFDIRVNYEKIGLYASGTMPVTMKSKMND